MGRSTAIERCRISGSPNLVTVLQLGRQALTGVFPKTESESVTEGPLDLVWCPDSGLLQLRHSYDLGELYGMNYGYRSGLNQSMVEHLRGKVEHLTRLQPVRAGDIVVDIGSNDGTTLRAYATQGLRRIGIDPAGVKFTNYYSDGLELIPEFFSADVLRRSIGGQRVRIVSSIAMFYDLEDPRKFVREIEEILEPEGIWHFEQSYMPTMLRMNAYDTVCHEHLEYYSLTVVNRLLDEAGLKVIDVQMNSVNGGSFAVTAAKKSSTFKPAHAIIDWLLDQEERMGLTRSLKPFRDFEERVLRHRLDLQALVRSLNADGKKVFGYGASTKGNVLLQFCQFTASSIPLIAEINPDKFGAYTPSPRIPIIPEAEARAMRPDYFLVLPWHFRDGIVRREREFLASGGRLIFPLPEIEII